MPIVVHTGPGTFRWFDDGRPSSDDTTLAPSDPRRNVRHIDASQLTDADWAALQQMDQIVRQQTAQANPTDVWRGAPLVRATAGADTLPPPAAGQPASPRPIYDGSGAVGIVPQGAAAAGAGPGGASPLAGPRAGTGTFGPTRPAQAGTQTPLVRLTNDLGQGAAPPAQGRTGAMFSFLPGGPMSMEPNASMLPTQPETLPSGWVQMPMPQLEDPASAIANQTAVYGAPQWQFDPAANLPWSALPDTIPGPPTRPAVGQAVRRQQQRYAQSPGIPPPPVSINTGNTGPLPAPPTPPISSSTITGSSTGTPQPVRVIDAGGNVTELQNGQWGTRQALPSEGGYDPLSSIRTPPSQPQAEFGGRGRGLGQPVVGNLEGQTITGESGGQMTIIRQNPATQEILEMELNGTRYVWDPTLKTFRAAGSQMGTPVMGPQGGGGGGGSAKKEKKRSYSYY